MGTRKVGAEGVLVLVEVDRRLEERCSRGRFEAGRRTRHRAPVLESPKTGWTDRL